MASNEEKNKGVQGKSSDAQKPADSSDGEATPNPDVTPENDANKTMTSPSHFRHGETEAKAVPEGSVTPAVAAARARADTFSLAGKKIGPYVIKTQLGSGGMGAVYLAEQYDPIRRQVALKVIKAGMDSEELLSRFRSERELIARMNHPNIAQVLDVGTTEEGRLYFAMEYVAGVPLNDFCDRRGLDLDHRLDLFLQVCEGVQHAHQKGVIHRDLKPSNLLVADYQGQIVVKVIDFGIAKSLDNLGRPEPGTTRAGIPIGTPNYMSPEQAAGDPEAIDTRTDVYSLGVILYKLISSELPIPTEVISRATNLDLARILREVEVKAPSRRVSDLARANTTDWRRYMANDQITHSKRLRGDLDWITLKALERDKERRYASVSEFAADLRRFLNEEPVLAGPPSRAYRIRKFISRHRYGVSAAAAVLLSLIAGMIGTAWMAFEAQQQRVRAEAALAETEKERDRAESESARAVATQRFLEDLIAAPDPWSLRSGGSGTRGAGGTPMVREVRVIDAIDQAAKDLDRTLASDPRLRGEIAMMLGRTLRRLGRLDAADRQLKLAVASMEKAYPENAPQRVHANLEYALVLADLAEIDTAKKILAPLLPVLNGIKGVPSETVEEGRRVMSQLLAQSGDYKKAIELAKENLALAIRDHGQQSTETSGAKSILAEILGEQGKWSEADTLFAEAYNAERMRLGPTHPIVVRLLSRLADLALRKGDHELAQKRFQEAILAAEQVLGPEHPDTLRQYAGLATALSNAGKFKEAIPLFNKILNLRARVLGGEDHIDVLTMRSNYALALRSEKRYAEAEKEMAEVYNRRRVVLGDTHPETIRTLSFLAALAKDRGDLAKAEVLFNQTAELYAQANGKNHPEALILENNYLVLVRNRGDLARAIAGYADLLKRAEEVLPATHWHLGSIRGNYGEALYLNKQYAEAEPLLIESWKTLSARFPHSDARVLQARERIVDLYRSWGKPKRAKEILGAAASS